MKSYLCECCGGQINVAKMQCEYCGTRYKEDRNDSLIRIETFSNPYKGICVACNFPDELIRLDPDKAAELAVRKITQKLAEDLVPFVRFRAERDYETCSHKVVGSVRVIVPMERGSSEMWETED